MATRNKSCTEIENHRERWGRGGWVDVKTRMTVRETKQYHGECNKVGGDKKRRGGGVEKR